MKPKEFEVIYKFTVTPSVPFPSALNWNVEPIGELIRCKDCKWNDGGEWVDCYMSGMHGRTSNKNYCSRAERKEHD